MSAENKLQQILEDVCEKLNNIGSVNEEDVSEIKKSVESIEELISGSQAKINFQEIKEKLETIAFQVDSTNDTLLKDLYDDINNIKTSTQSVTQHLDNIQNVQNMALTRAEFDEYQKQQLDLAIKSNENIFSELKAIKESTTVNGQRIDAESIKLIGEQVEVVHDSLKKYISEIAQNVRNTPRLSEISDVVNDAVTDLNNVTNKNIKQTNVVIKEVQAELIKFHSDFQGKEFVNQIEKISEIYDSLDVITSWIKRVGDINSAIENVYARLGLNIDFDDVSEKVDIIYENITTLNSWAMKIDKLDTSLPELQSKMGLLTAIISDTGNIITALTVLKDYLHSTLSDNLNFEDLSDKIDIVYENLSALNQWAIKIDSVAEKLDENSQTFSDVKENVNNVSDNVGNISDKVNIISDNIDTVSGNIRGISEDINVLSDKINNISDKYADISNVSGTADDFLISIIAFSDSNSNFLS